MTSVFRSINASGFLAAVVLAWPVVSQAQTRALPAAATHPVDFEKEIRPILERSCYDCHGPRKQESDFRLDVPASALKGGEHGVDILPGKSAESRLIHLVSGTETLVMPKKGPRLSDAEIGLIRAWIDQGAVFPASASKTSKKDHWAFKAPVRPELPKVRNQRWIRNPIDRFVLAKLQAEKLSPSPEADRVTLIRRLSLDLIGLPPTPREVDEFVSDRHADAYEKLVERLLDSPHYGERWGRHWLDAARYADSDGYEKDKSRNVWFYRDWVVRAFNRDLPYNEFVIEQLAGDLLPNATQEQIVATGFLRNSMINEEGGIDPEQFRMDAMFDRMDAVGKGVLGLTIQCAQCHNHKFDPLKQEEYYRLFAFLNNDHESQRVVYRPDEMMKVESLSRSMREIEEDLRHRNPDWEKKMAQWEESVSKSKGDWSVLTVTNASDNSQRYISQKDGSLLAQGYAPTKLVGLFRGTTPLKTITGFRLELFTDPNLPCNGPGRSYMGTCALTDFSVEAVDASNPSNKVNIKIAKASADFGNPEREVEPNFYDKSDKYRTTGPIEFAIDGKDDTAWGIDSGPGRRNQDRKAVFVPEKPVEFTNGCVLTFHLKQFHGGWNSDDHMNNNLGRFRLSVTGAPDPAADPLPRRVREILSIPAGQRTAHQKEIVFSTFRLSVPEWKEANEKIEKLWSEWPRGSTALTLAPRSEPRTTSVLKRGDWLKPTREVTPGVPAFLHPLPENAPPTRLTLARWLVDPRSPTTARVFVNRIWQAYFGIGLVSTPEDFGTQSEPPSHPEMLDWLACEFMEHGWSIKHVHRLIVNSSTYRQSSKVSPELHTRDPYNRLLARGPRFRVEGEIVHDIALASSGLLNDRIGGRSVMPPAPPFLFMPPASYAPFPWVDETDDDKYRRAIYTFRRRSTPYPPLQTFDVPNGDISCVRRLRSNSPLQALVSLNEPIFVEAAQALARRTLAEGGRTDASRIEYAFRRVLSRKPSEPERQELEKLLQKQLKRLADGWLNPGEIATGEPVVIKNVPPGSTPAELAAFTVVSRVLLNLDEAITKE